MYYYKTSRVNKKIYMQIWLRENGRDEYIASLGSADKAFKILLEVNKIRRMAQLRSKSDRIRGVTQDLRYKVFKRDNYCCQICGKKGQRNGGTSLLHIDHVVPIFFGGSNEEYNLQTLCRECNLKKSDKIISPKPKIQNQLVGLD